MMEVNGMARFSVHGLRITTTGGSHGFRDGADLFAALNPTISLVGLGSRRVASVIISLELTVESTRPRVYVTGGEATSIPQSR